MAEEIADICIVTEGSYPYLKGGVAEWCHELIGAQKEKTFHVVTLMPLHQKLKVCYEFPPNVIGHSMYRVQYLPKGSGSFSTPKKAWDVIGPMLKGLISLKNFDDFDPIFKFFDENRDILGKRILTESEKTWDFFINLYREMIPNGPFKAYFGTIYALSQSIYSLILPKIPKAKIYHAVCTGYAGFILYRAKKEFDIPCLLTEHGIYSNERRIEIAMSEWITEMGSLDLALEDKKKSLKDFWLNAFFSMSHVCYKSCEEILTTFDGNQSIQLEGGADKDKLKTIVYGVDMEKYADIVKKEHPLTVAFIGRFVPIKDVKTYIRACKFVNNKLPDVRLLLIGPTSEDEEYYNECLDLVKLLGLEDKLQFLGHVNLKEYFAEIDVLVLTSISEAQPLVMLETGAAGIPFVATNVGACHQLIYGDERETPNLGQGGVVTPLSNPEATANGIIKLMSDKEFYNKCSIAIKNRIGTYYRLDKHHEEYRKIYEKYLNTTQQEKK
jgi:polysaccharide biosynthesis protein PelF